MFFEIAPEVGTTIKNLKGIEYVVTDIIYLNGCSGSYIMAIKADGSSSRKMRFHKNQIQG